MSVTGATVPAAVSALPRELHPAPRSWAEWGRHPHVVHRHEVDEGDHVAAWHEPDLSTAEVRAAFRPLCQRGTS
jgi:hypothetical protein